MLQQLKEALAQNDSQERDTNVVHSEVTESPRATLSASTDESSRPLRTSPSRPTGAIRSRRVSARRNEQRPAVPGPDTVAQDPEETSEQPASTSSVDEEEEDEETMDTEAIGKLEGQNEVEKPKKWRSAKELKKEKRRQKSYIPATRPWTDPSELTRDEIKIELKKRNYMV